MVTVDETKHDPEMDCLSLETLPKRFKLATLEDFFVVHKCFDKRHKKKIGMQYLLQSAIDQRYYVKEVHELTLDIDLIPFIKHEMVFVDPEDVKVYTNKILAEPKHFDVTEWYLK